MTSKARKAEQKLANVCQQLGITQNGHFWLDHALDPFKDLIAPHPGYVDKTTEPSVVEVVKQTVTITAPGAGNWDCQLFLDQTLFQQSLFQTTVGTTVYQRSGQGATPYTRGGLVARKAASGTALDITQTDNASCIGIDTALYTSEDCRIIGIGFEVHDTTQELKKQGSVVVYRVDQPPEQLFSRSVTIDAGVTACQPTAVTAMVVLAPPTTAAQALDISGSKQWEAKEGVYITPVQVCDVNPPLANRNLAMDVSENGLRYFPLISQSGAQALITCSASNAVNPWSMSGCFFTGLDPAATLTVNLNYMIERFPNRSSAIRRLCYPSPQYDPRALELYSIIAREMPVGVTVDQNGIGDWIAGIANIASGALAMIPHPLPKMIAAGIQTIGNNKLIQQGTSQIIRQIENKPKDKKVLALPQGTEVVSVPNNQVCVIQSRPANNNNNNNNRSNVSQGNFVPNRKAEFKRPNQLANLGNAAMGSDSPWTKTKMKKATGTVATNM